MEKRVLLFIFLTFLVLYGYQALFPPPPTPTPEGVEAPPQAQGVPPEPPSASTAATEPGAAPEVMTEPATLPETVVGDADEREITVETPEVVAVFTNRGARLKSWRLKRYLDEQGEPLELLATRLPGDYPAPFSLIFEDQSLTAVLNSALFHVTAEPPTGVQTTAVGLSFEYQNAEGLQAAKSFQVLPGTYLVELDAQVMQDGRELLPAVAWGPSVGNPRVQTTRWDQGPGGLVFLDADVERVPPGRVAEKPRFEGPLGFAGVDDHYFVTVVVHPGPSSVTFERIPAPPIEGSDSAPADLVSWTIAGDQLPSPLTFFAGPKDFDVLAAVDRDLVRAINFGIFAVIVVPLLRTLNWIYGFIGNYGWSIVLLTVIINAVMFPLRHKSVVSMRKMQEIQPEAKAIQERYAKLKATDPAKQKMNQELMGLYRDRGVNPAGGCLPMLLTMPVLFAFYSLLTVSIELRGAPFFGWIHDLSAPDPYFVTPVLMGATQMWQQWMTPQAGVDPAQQKIMRLMPLMFMIFMLWLPAGVTLYWLVSNVWSIGQTYVTNYLIGPPAIRAVRPPAERRVKRVGAGRTDAAAGEK